MAWRATPGAAGPSLKTGDWLIAHGTIASDLSSAAFIVTQRVGRVFGRTATNAGEPQHPPGGRRRRDAGRLSVRARRRCRTGRRAAAGASAPQSLVWPGGAVPRRATRSGPRSSRPRRRSPVLAAKARSSAERSDGRLTPRCRGPPNPDRAGALRDRMDGDRPGRGSADVRCLLHTQRRHVPAASAAGACRARARRSTPRASAAGWSSCAWWRPTACTARIADTGAHSRWPTSPRSPGCWRPGNGRHDLRGAARELRWRGRPIAQDGAVADAGLAWTTRREVTLGSGSATVRHRPSRSAPTQVTLTATNSRGPVGVHDGRRHRRWRREPPRADADGRAPSAIGWHVAAPGEHPRQGPGDGRRGQLRQRAPARSPQHSSAAWLSVSAAGGRGAGHPRAARPVPSGIPDGASEDAVRDTGRGRQRPARRSRWPVHLCVGNTFAGRQHSRCHGSRPPAGVTVAATEAGGAAGEWLVASTGRHS